MNGYKDQQFPLKKTVPMPLPENMGLYEKNVVKVIAFP